MSTGNINIQTPNSSPRSIGKPTTVRTHPTPISRSSSYHDFLLAIDLGLYKDDAEKLHGYAVDLQSRCRQLSHKPDNDLDRSQSGKSSRRTTDDSITKKKEAATAASRKGIAITLNPANNKLEVVQMKDMTDSDYVAGELPTFHWWSDRLHIYFRKNNDQKLSGSHSRHEVIVLKRKLPKTADEGLTFKSTVRLGKLGLGIKFRRIVGQLKAIHVRVNDIEMTAMKPQQNAPIYQDTDNFPT